MMNSSEHRNVVLTSNEENIEETTVDTSDQNVEPSTLVGTLENNNEEDVQPLDLSIHNQLEPNMIDNSENSKMRYVGNQELKDSSHPNEESVKISSIQNDILSDCDIQQEISVSKQSQSIAISSTSENAHDENVEISSLQNNISVSDVQQKTSVSKQSQSISILSSIENVKMPQKIIAVGRPKGSMKTVIRTNRKRENVPTASKIVTHDYQACNLPSKKRFLDISQDEQALTILQWLTNIERTNIPKKKVSCKDIIKNPIIFHRLRNDEIFFDSLKKYVDLKCFQFLKDEVASLHGKHWKCAMCNLDIKGKQIMCHVSLDWFHF